MKHLTAITLALSALLFTACAAPDPAQSDSPATEPAAASQETVAAPAASSGPLHILNSGGTAPQFAITDTAAYLPMKFGNILLATEIDFDTAQQRLLCDADSCTHTDETCAAFMAADNDSLSQYYTGGLAAAGDRLYWFIGGGASPLNVRVDVSALDGSNRRTIAENQNLALLDYTMSMHFAEGSTLYLATESCGLVSLDESGVTRVFPLDNRYPTPENPLYAENSRNPRCTILGCWQDMAVFSCEPARSGHGTGLIGVHTDGTVTDLGSYSTDFGSPASWMTTLHNGKIYHVPGSGNQAETIEITSLTTQSTEALPLPSGYNWQNVCSVYGDGTIGLSSDEINYAWMPGSDTAAELSPTWYKDTSAPRSPVIYAENGTMALIKIGESAASTAHLSPQGLPYQRQQTSRELALIPLQELFSGSQNWTAVATLDGVLFD